ncbi:MAG: prolyl aminopeptidase [Gammaproteobacteria bacterium]|nr:prolyl aminopeptidase [Gammaproteobacteria bacterium]
MSQRKGLYPPITPYSSGYLRVSPLHELYYEECGNPQGKPVVFLHGGPGAGINAAARRFFDPKIYRVILFDQRGAGKSRPHASTDDNTTWKLVEDIETLRVFMGVERWQVFGGSWGSTLALAYAQKHPERVSELVLRGIFLLRHQEIQWFYQQGASSVFPDHWENFLAPVPEAQREDMVASYARLLSSPDREERLHAARAWSLWEGVTSNLEMADAGVTQFAADDFALALARIEVHYFVNNGFFDDPDQLLRDIDIIRHIPTVIVQGRYDLVCPMVSAWDLHSVWPEAGFFVVPDAGHSSFEPGIIHELVTATQGFSGKI